MVFTSDELLSKVVNLLPRCPLVKYVIFFSNGVIQKHSGKAVEDLGRFNETARLSVEAARKALPESVRLYDILELEEQGRIIIREELATDAGPLINWQPPIEERPKPNDLAVIMYTSGSTGMSSTSMALFSRFMCDWQFSLMVVSSGECAPAFVLRWCYSNVE